MKTLLIVEDDRMLREALVDDSRSSSPDWSVHGCGSIAAAEELLAQTRIDAAFVDLGLPDGDGIALIRRLAAANPACDILVITVFADEQRVLRSLEAGACGYLLKTDLPHHGGRLVSTIETGGSPVSPSIARYLIERLQPARRRRPPPGEDIAALSQREHEILGLCAKGLRYAEIARALGLSVHTVNAHLKSIYRKLMVNSRTEAVYEARQAGMLDD